MTGKRSQQDLAEAVVAADATAGSRPGRARRGLRLALLSAAAAIVLLGAVTAGVSGYLMISRARPGYGYRAAQVAGCRHDAW